MQQASGELIQINELPGNMHANIQNYLILRSDFKNSKEVDWTCSK
jgi:hypothetical protein